jgi:hypothetical protein
MHREGGALLLLYHSLHASEISGSVCRQPHCLLTVCQCTLAHAAKVNTIVNL